MATIAILNEDGSYIGVYLRRGGHLERAGKTLVEHYNDENKARELVSLGNLYELKETLPKCAAANKTVGGAHATITIYETERALLRNVFGIYVYVFDPRENAWLYSVTCCSPRVFLNVADKLGLDLEDYQYEELL